MKGWLRRNYPSHEMVSAMTPATETPPPMVSEIRAMDVSLPVLARRRAEAKIEANKERERSRGRSGLVEYVAKMLAAPPPPKRIPLRQMRAAPAALDGPVPDAAVFPRWLSKRYDGWSGASCKGNAYGGWEWSLQQECRVDRHQALMVYL